MTNQSNAWLGDFHKALEQRKEPKPELTPPTDPFGNHPFQDCLDTILGPRLLGIDPNLMLQWSFYTDSIEIKYRGGTWSTLYHRYEIYHGVYRIEGDFERRVRVFLRLEPGHLTGLSEADFRQVIATFPTRNDPPWPGCDAAHMPPSTPRDEELASRALEYVVGPLADVAQACAIARAEGFKDGRRFVPAPRAGTADSDVNCIWPNFTENFTEDEYFFVKWAEVLRTIRSTRRQGSTAAGGVLDPSTSSSWGV